MYGRGFYASLLSIGAVGVCLFSGCTTAVEADDPPPPTQEQLLAGQLSEKELEFYRKLRSTQQTVFLSFSPQQRQEAMFFAEKKTPREAIYVAMGQDILRLPKEQQRIYAQADGQMQRLFFALDGRWTAWVVDHVDEGMAVDQAIDHAFKEQCLALTAEESVFFERLSREGRFLFCALGDEAQNQILVFARKMTGDAAVERGAQVDINRLSTAQRTFCHRLTPEEKAVFLLLTPQMRGLSVLLTYPIDPNLAVDYTASLTATSL